MLIYAIDDEPKMLRLLHNAIEEAAPKAEIRDFHLGAEVIDFMETEGEKPDAVFSDIQMPGLTGLELAAKLKELAPDTKIIFVTSYDYAVSAYRLHVHGYIQKPVDAEQIKEELACHFRTEAADENKLKVQCFGSFEVFWHKEPLSFTRTKTKELFAYLVDRRGAMCSTDEIIVALWEEDIPPENAKHRVRNLKADLKEVLKRIEMEEVLVLQGHKIGVKTDLLDCDYYRMLAGEISEVNAFRGEYMEQYSWAEITKASLF